MIVGVGVRDGVNHKTVLVRLISSVIANIVSVGANAICVRVDAVAVSSRRESIVTLIFIDKATTSITARKSRIIIGNARALIDNSSQAK